MGKIWLVTGAGSGLGHHVVKAVLEAGGSVVAGARRPEALDALRERFGGRLLPVKLDVRDEDAAKAAVGRALEVHGRLDVLVNNAGYQLNAPFEQISSEQFRDVVETCLFGVINTTRAAVPVMREQRGGHVFQVSSIGGRVTVPGNSPYHAAKWAVGGFSDSLADEVAPFGIKVCTLEPGGIATGFRRRASDAAPPLMPDYEQSVGPTYASIAAVGAPSENDPARIARLMIRLADADSVPKRLVLGQAAQAYVDSVEATRADAAKIHRALSVSTVFPDVGPQSSS